MELIVHKIRLNPGISAETFENWVVEHDYASCKVLPSLVSFSVQRTSAHPAASYDYFEIIVVTSFEEFQQDMATPVFAALEAGFSKLAKVVEEVRGVRVEPGFERR